MSKILLKYNNNLLKRNGNIFTGYEGTPTCDFNASGSSASQIEIVIGDSLNFYDTSLKKPTSWNWNLGTGTPSTSTNQNPTSVLFDTTGLTNISLTASNAFGTNTKTKTDYISVITGYKKLAISFYATDLYSTVPYYSGFTWTPTGMSQRSWTFNMLPSDKAGWPPTTGCTMNLRYTDNTTSKYIVRIGNPPFDFVYAQGYQTGNDTGIYPDVVIRKSVVNTSYPIKKEFVRLSGLTTTTTYKLTFFCSREHSAYPPTSVYTITGGTSKDGTSVAYTGTQSDDNYLITYSITGIAPSSVGIIDIAVDYTTNSGMLTCLEIDEGA